jgi:hypothetical protein
MGRWPGRCRARHVTKSEHRDAGPSSHAIPLGLDTDTPADTAGAGACRRGKPDRRPLRAYASQSQDSCCGAVIDACHVYPEAARQREGEAVSLLSGVIRK